MCDSKRRRVRESSRVSQQKFIMQKKRKKIFTHKLFRQQNENKMWLMSCVIFFFSFYLPLLLRLASSSLLLYCLGRTVVLGWLQKRKNYDFFFSWDLFYIAFFLNFFFWTSKSSNGNDSIFFFSCVHTAMCAWIDSGLRVLLVCTLAPNDRACNNASPLLLPCVYVSPLCCLSDCMYQVMNVKWFSTLTKPDVYSVWYTLFLSLSLSHIKVCINNFFFCDFD
jgi:hypothetical protein